MIRRFTWVELLVVTVIIAVSLAILMPALNSDREAQRRTTCHSKCHLIGIAMRCYEFTFNNAFPPSASVAKAADGTRTVGGYSFLVRLLPFMDYDSLYKTLPQNGNPADASNQAVLVAMNLQVWDFLCPSGPRDSTQQATVQLQSAGITNYKAMGASTRGSLVMAVNPQATPPYGVAKIHPDGSIFPGDGVRAADVVDGPSHTIFIIETIDEIASRWTVGKEATLVGLPQKSSPTGPTPQAPYNYFTPLDYISDGTWGSDSAVTKAGLRTFLSYDFSPTGADTGKYEDPRFGQTPPAYGPSSMHPGVVICSMGDGSTQALSKQIDAANLFFLITKNNDDPFYLR